MTTSDGTKLQQALDAATSGDLDPLVALFAPELEWRGTTRGHLWWRRTPS
jgi:ketosteroid isomerase-like protein